MDDRRLWVVKGKSRELTYGSWLGDSRYRLTATALSMPGRLRLGAVVEAVADSDGSLVVDRLVERSPYRSTATGLSRQEMESPVLDALKASVTAARGNWEQVLGGIFIVHLPRGGDDPRHLIVRSLGHIVRLKLHLK
jgi:hypothetical protein